MHGTTTIAGAAVRPTGAIIGVGLTGPLLVTTPAPPPGAAGRGAPRTGDRAAAATGRAWCSVHHDRRRPAPHRHHRRRLDARPRHAEPAARRGSGLRRGRVPPLWAQAGRR